MLKYWSLLGVWGAGLAIFFGAVFPGMAAERQVLHGHVPSALARFNLQPAGRLPVTKNLQLAVGLPLRNQQALDDLLRQIYDPASPNYRHYLTPEQIAEQFGPSEQDYQSFIAFAEKNGLTVTGTYPNRTLLDISGSVASIQRVFHVTMRVYQHPREARTFYAPDVEPSLDLAVPVLHISGLDNFVLPRPMNLHVIPLEQLTRTVPASGSGPSGLYMGNDFRAAYAPGVSLDGAGQVVGLLELDGYYPNDITAYENQAGLPNVPLTNVLVDSFSGAAGGNNIEVALDIEVAIAMATNVSKVIVYEGPNPSGTIDILARMASDNLAKQISSSWLIGDDPNADVQYKIFATQGQSFFQASGDNGAFYSGIVQWADDTNITLVGGTTLTMTGSGGAWSSESAWNWYITDPPNTDSTGGGINFNSIPIPIWQQGINMTTNNGSTTLRNIPDVALTADNILVRADNGASYYVGGTSAAAPLWAGYTALINQQALAAGRSTVGFINPAVYAIGKSTNFTADFHDIATGNNTNASSPNNYFAVPGYDLCTGWGTPVGQSLITALAGPPDVLIITPLAGFNAFGAVGGPFTVTSQTFALTNSGANSLNWRIASTSSWVNVSSTSGTLVVAGQTSVNVSLNSAASNLVAGTYVANVWFTNQTSGNVQNREFTLQVGQPLVITPTTGFTSTGPVGGPFNVTAQNFSLTNIGTGSLDWSIINTSLWLDASPTSGTLAPNGATATVTVSLNSTANSLAGGIYAASLWFTNLTGHTAQSVPFTLQVGQSILQNGGFETGDFSFWSLSGTSASSYNAVVSSSTYSGYLVHSGTYGAFLGEAGSLAYLSQTLPTIPGQVYLLSFWFENPNVIFSGGVTPNQFVVNWNTNSPSVNTIFNQINMAALNTWTNMTFILTATGTNTTLQFGSRNDPAAFGLDDINVWPIPNPSFRSASKTSANAVAFSWNSLASIAYQVQFSTNLTKTNWIILSTNIATGSVLTFTNSYGTDIQRFYRIRRLP